MRILTKVFGHGWLYLLFKLVSICEKNVHKGEQFKKVFTKIVRKNCNISKIFHFWHVQHSHLTCDSVTWHTATCPTLTSDMWQCHMAHCHMLNNITIMMTLNENVVLLFYADHVDVDVEALSHQSHPGCPLQVI